MESKSSEEVELKNTFGQKLRKEAQKWAQDYF